MNALRTRAFVAARAVIGAHRRRNVAGPSPNPGGIIFITTLDIQDRIQRSGAVSGQNENESRPEAAQGLILAPEWDNCRYWCRS